jgi:hypothetical protein
MRIPCTRLRLLFGRRAAAFRLSGLSLDARLGGRMLLKYPGLTLAGGLALAIAIGIGAGWYDLWGKLLWPTIRCPMAIASSSSKCKMSGRTGLSSVSLETSSNGRAMCGRSTVSGRTGRSSGI